MRDWLLVEPRSGRRPTGTQKMLREFITERAPAYGYTADQLFERDQRKPISAARQMLMAVAYATGRWSYPSLGIGFQRDYSTVIHAVKKVRALHLKEAA